MGQPFIGEIRMFGGNFAPLDWHFCDGSLLPISQYSALFNLIGTTYGGDGVNTFALPNLLGRAPVHQGTNPQSGTYILGQLGGVENVTLTTNQMPSHTHLVQVAGAAQGGAVAIPSSSTVLADEVITGSPSSLPRTYIPYNGNNAQVSLAANSISTAGGSLPHDNMQPFLAISFIISLFGIYPSQN
jgi:microcystin-dependent protein